MKNSIISFLKLSREFMKYRLMEQVVIFFMQMQKGYYSGKHLSIQALNIRNAVFGLKIPLSWEGNRISGSMNQLYSDGSLQEHIIGMVIESRLQSGISIDPEST